VIAADVRLALIVILAEPLKLAEPVSSSPRLIVLAVCKVVAVLAFPVKFPSKVLATRVPAVIVRLPVFTPVKVPVPTINLSALSSQPMLE
jgi:hypothetical protein